MFHKRPPAPVLARLVERKLELEAALQIAIEHQEPPFVIEALTEEFKEASKLLESAERAKEEEAEVFTDVTILHDDRLVRPASKHFQKVTRPELKTYIAQNCPTAYFTLLAVEKLPECQLEQLFEPVLQCIEDVPIKSGHTYAAVGASRLPLRSKYLALAAAAVAVNMKWKRQLVRHVTSWLKEQGHKDAYQLPMDTLMVDEQVVVEVDAVIATSGRVFLVVISPVVSNASASRLSLALDKLRSIQADEMAKIDRLDGLELSGVLCGDRLVNSQQHLWNMHRVCAKHGIGVLLSDGTALNASLQRSPSPSKVVSKSVYVKGTRKSSAAATKPSVKPGTIVCMLQQPVCRVTSRRAVPASAAAACAWSVVRTRHMRQPACKHSIL